VRAAARPEPAPKRLARRLRAPWQTLPLGAAALFLIAGLAVLLFRGSHEQQQAARYQPTTPGPAAQAPTAAPRETGSSATTATRESTPGAPPARSRKLETAKNRVEQPAPAEPRAETTAPRTMAERQGAAPAAAPDVSAHLRVPDVTLAELSLIELAARVGGRQTGRRIDGGRVVVELAVPRDAYAQFVREATALGSLSIERQATERPVLAVTVTVSN